MFTFQTYVRRRDELRHLLQGGIVLLPGNRESAANYTSNAYHFRQDSTFLYYFGLNLPDLAGVIDLDSGEDVLYGDDFTVDDIIWMGPQPTIAELGSWAGVKKTAPSAALQGVVQTALTQGRKIHVLPPYRGETELLLQSLLGRKPEVSVELIRAVVSMRDKKSPEEIAQIEEACETGYRMHTAAMRMCRPGVVEREIAGAIEGIAMQYGWGVSFLSIVSQHGETLHNHCYDGVLEPGRLLLVDAGAEAVSNYCSDNTRTMPVSGRFNRQQREVYDIVLAAHDRAFEVARPGIPYRDVHLEAARVIIEGLKSLGLVKGSTDEAVAAGAHALFMPHGLGHLMGLDVHDMENLGEQYVGYDAEIVRSTELATKACRMGRRLETGMVVTVEPGIYFIPAYIDKWREEGICKDFIAFDRLAAYESFGGIRLEDDLLVTSDGSRMLGDRRIPITPEEVEEYMQRD